jgi:hypothetical protein
MCFSIIYYKYTRRWVQGKKHGLLLGPCVGITSKEGCKSLFWITNELVIVSWESFTIFCQECLQQNDKFHLFRQNLLIAMQSHGAFQEIQSWECYRKLQFKKPLGLTVQIGDMVDNVNRTLWYTCNRKKQFDCYTTIWLSGAYYFLLYSMYQIKIGRNNS